jgi:pimeloyl-ACP methyl ester carboxylesterase
MPANATPAAQADAFAALLDTLGLEKVDVIGFSAGTTSALQFALRHPNRVKHLAILVGNFPGSPTAVVQPPSAKFQRQFVMWALWTFAPSTMIRMVAAVPKEFVMTSENVRYVNEFIDSLFPISAAGFVFDAFISNRTWTRRAAWPLSWIARAATVTRTTPCGRGTRRSRRCRG